MTRQQWANNPLGYTGNFIGTDNQRWRTERNTAETGRNGCRSYRMTTVYFATPTGVAGQYESGQRNEWVFNHLVLFGNYARG